MKVQAPTHHVRDISVGVSYGGKHLREISPGGAMPCGVSTSLSPPSKTRCPVHKERTTTLWWHCCHAGNVKDPSSGWVDFGVCSVVFSLALWVSWVVKCSETARCSIGAWFLPIAFSFCSIPHHRGHNPSSGMAEHRGCSTTRCIPLTHLSTDMALLRSHLKFRAVRARKPVLAPVFQIRTRQHR